VHMDGTKGEWYLAKQIAVGILIAAAVIFVGLHLYTALALRAANEAAEDFVRQSQHDIQVQSQQREAARQAQAERKAASELARRQETARQTQAAAERARIDQANRAAKESAWRQFYKPLKKCDNPPDWDTQVECGNTYVRAKREFEASWARGGFQ
jgi:hypothetical protein